MHDSGEAGGDTVAIHPEVHVEQAGQTWPFVLMSTAPSTLTPEPQTWPAGAQHRQAGLQPLFELGHVASNWGI